MEKLLAALRAVEAAATILNADTDEETGQVWLTDGTEDDLDPLVKEVLEHSGWLITKEGRPDWHAHAVLKGNGFRVTKGESDSFGWLTGCIHTSKGIIVYG